MPSVVRSIHGVLSYHVPCQTSGACAYPQYVYLLNTSSEVARVIDQKPTKSRMMEIISIFIPRSGQGVAAKALNMVMVVMIPPKRATRGPTVSM